MSQFQSFDNLLATMQESILKAHELIETQHLAVMKKYFDDSGRPKMMTVQIPINKEHSGESEASISESEIAYQEIKIPTFALIPQYSLKLHEIKMDFDVKMVSWDDKPERKERRQGLLTNILYSSSDKESSNDVHVELSFVASEPPEGVMKVNDMLIRMLP